MSKAIAETAKRRARRQFPYEFRAARLVLDEGKSVAAVARDLDLTETALSDWVHRAPAGRTNGRTGLTTAERAELARSHCCHESLRLSSRTGPVSVNSDC